MENGNTKSDFGLLILRKAYSGTQIHHGEKYDLHVPAHEKKEELYVLPKMKEYGICIP
jgi:hypothetical protein